MGRMNNPDLSPSEDLAYLLGVILGDGYVNKRANYVCLTTTTREFNRKFEDSLKQIGLNPYCDLDRGQFPRTRAFSKKLVALLTSLTLRDVEKLVSENRAFLIAFIEGIYEAEGGFHMYEFQRISKGGTSYLHHPTRLDISNIDYQLIIMLKRLLKKAGFNFGISTTKTPKGLPYYRLFLTKRNEALRFINMIRPCIKGGV